MSRRSRRKFTDEFKAETVKLIRESGRRVGSVARDLDLTETAVRDWVKKAESSGSESNLRADERDELRRLRKEVRELRMEKEILQDREVEKELIGRKHTNHKQVGGLILLVLKVGQEEAIHPGQKEDQEKGQGLNMVILQDRGEEKGQTGKNHISHQLEAIY